MGRLALAFLEPMLDEPVGRSGGYMAIAYALQEIRMNLEAKRRELLAALARQGGIDVVRTPDQMDEVTLATDREVATSSLERRVQLMRQITDAQGRIAAGTYGRCVRCGDQIATARLYSVPWTPYCLRCQEVVERENASGLAVSVE